MKSLPRFGEGSNFFEVVQFCTIAALSIGLNDLFLDRFSLRDHIGQGKLIYVSFFVQYGILVLPSLLGFTILEDKLIYIIVFLVMFVFIIRYSVTPNYSSEALRKIPGVDYYSNYRAMLQLLTAIAILGVDFPVFPRRFAKTNKYGVSVMDTGTAAFTFAMGFGHSLFLQHKPEKNKIMKIIKQAAIMMILGGIRPVLVQLTGHHHEVTEYGLHWNFFLTLGIVLLFSLLPGFSRIMIAVSMNVYLSTSTVFGSILNEESRNWNNFFEANKEGICSLAGYFLVYEFAYRFGEELVKKNGKCASTNSIKFCLSACFFAFILWKFGEYSGMKPSRRIANFSYVMLSVCLNTFSISMSMMMELFLFPRPPKLGEKTFGEKFGRSSIKAFMVSNLMTFVVNRIWDTEKVEDDIYGFSILVLYMVVVCLLVMMDSIFRDFFAYLTFRVYCGKRNIKEN